MLVNLGLAMESNYTVRKVYSDLLKALNVICFVPSLYPPGELSPDTKRDRGSAPRSALHPQSSRQLPE